MGNLVLWFLNDAIKFLVSNVVFQIPLKTAVVHQVFFIWFIVCI